MAAVMQLASKLCVQNEYEEENQHGELLPCRKLSPLSPYLKLEEYHMLERDKGKYLLYMAAINQAMADIVERATERPKDLCAKCLVLGPGLGRLIRFCIDAAQQQGVNVMVHTIEANPMAVKFLRNEFADTLGKEVFVYDPFIFHPSVTKSDLPEGISVHCRTFDIVVSELLGCFGDDEFLPELTSAAARMFLREQHGIMIPQSWTSYVVPVFSPRTHDFLKILKRPFDACYVIGFPKDCLFLSDSVAVWSGSCYEVADEYSADKEFRISLASPQLPNDRTKMNCKMCVQNLKDNCSFLNEKVFCCREAQQSARIVNFGIPNADKPQGEVMPLTSEPRAETSTQNLKLNLPLGNKDSSTEHAVIWDNYRAVPVKNRFHNALLQTPQSEVVRKKFKGNITVKSVTFENNPQTDLCKCPCHIHSQKIHNADATGVNNVFVHGFIGYFTAVLYGEIMIDTRHTSPGRNSFHWECFFFPLREPIRITLSSSPSCDLLIKLYLRRKCENLTRDESLKLWYQWQAEVTGCVCNACMSRGGSKSSGEELSGKALHDTKLSDCSSASLLPAQMNKHKYLLQNADGNCDAVFLQFKNSSGIK